MRMSPFALKYTRKLFRMAMKSLWNVFEHPKMLELPANNGKFVVRAPTRYSELFSKPLILNTISKSTG